MKFRSIFASLLAALALTVSVTSCDSDDSNETVIDQITEDHRVAYVLCNGKMGANNGSVTLMYLDAQPISITPSIYAKRNGKLAGDLAQDFLYQDGYFFMTVASSKSLVKMNFAGMEVSRYEFPEADGNPRYMAYHAGKLYVTVWGTGVVVFDAATMERVKNIEVGVFPEHIQVWNNKIFVANQSNAYAAPPVISDVVSVINPVTDTKEKDLVVSQNPTNLLVCDGQLYVSSQGNYADVAPSVQRVAANGADYVVTEVAQSSNVWTDNSKLYMVKETWAPDYSSKSNEFAVYDPKTSELTNGFFLKGKEAGFEESTFYMFYYDEKSDRYFVGTTDYVNNGDIHVFDGELNFVEQVDAGGVNPTKMVVVDL